MGRGREGELRKGNLHPLHTSSFSFSFLCFVLSSQKFLYIISPLWWSINQKSFLYLLRSNFKKSKSNSQQCNRQLNHLYPPALICYKPNFFHAKSITDRSLTLIILRISFQEDLLLTGVPPILFVLHPQILSSISSMFPSGIPKSKGSSAILKVSPAKQVGDVGLDPSRLSSTALQSLNSRA